MERRCEHIQPLLPEWVDGALEGERAGLVAVHVTGCPECSALVAVLRDGVTAEEGEPDAKLTAAILAETTGSSCERALSQLVEYSDDGLEHEVRHLMALHLGHCPRCGPVAAVLGWLPPVLVEMRELAVDEEFLGEVLAATVGIESSIEQADPETARAVGEPGRFDRGLAVLDRRLEQLIAAARHLTARPMFAAEAAYAATVILALLVATPVSPFKQMPQQALAWLQGAPAEDGAVTGSGPFGGIREEAQELRSDIGQEASGRFARWRGAVYTDLSARGQGGWDGLKSLGSAADGVRRAVMGEEGHEMGPALSAISGAVRVFWQGITLSGPAAEQDGATETSSPQARQERGP